MMELNEAITGLFVTILTTAVAVITRAVQVYLRQLEMKAQQEIGVGNWAWLMNLADTAVRAADQYRESKGWDGQAAKQYAVRELVNQATAVGIPLSRQQADAIVEGVLNAIREGQYSVPDAHTLDGQAVIEPLPAGNA